MITLDFANSSLIIAIFLAAAIVALIAARLNIPYQAGLVLVGLALAWFTPLALPVLNPGIFLEFLIPIIIFAAALQVRFQQVRKYLPVSLAVALGCVFLTGTGITSLALWLGKYPLTWALAAGILFAAGDPSALLASLRHVQANVKLKSFLAAELLFSASLAVALLNSAHLDSLDFSLNIGAWIFRLILTTGGGLAVGATLALLVSILLNRMPDSLVDLLLAGIMACGAYLLSEKVFGFSGIAAVLAAGLVVGEFVPKGLTLLARASIISFWEFAAFLANATILVWAASQVNLELVFQLFPQILLALLVILAARALGVYGLSPIQPSIPIKWKHISFWSGLRGALPLALAFAWQGEKAAELQAICLGVVLFSILVEALTVRPIIKMMEQLFREPHEAEYETWRARLLALQAARSHIAQQAAQGALSQPTARTLSTGLGARMNETRQSLENLLAKHPDLEEEERSAALRSALQDQVTVLSRLFSEQNLSEPVYLELLQEITLQAEHPEKTLQEFQARLTAPQEAIQESANRPETDNLS